MCFVWSPGVYKDYRSFLGVVPQVPSTLLFEIGSLNKQAEREPLWGTISTSPALGFQAHAAAAPAFFTDAGVYAQKELYQLNSLFSLSSVLYKVYYLFSILY